MAPSTTRHVTPSRASASVGPELGGVNVTSVLPITLAPIDSRTLLALDASAMDLHLGGARRTKGGSRLRSRLILKLRGD